MSLPWVRLDSNIASHDKVVPLLSLRDGHKAFTLYVCALGYAGGHGTDGFISRDILPFIHGSERLAQMLVDARGRADKAGLWEIADGGWTIHNYAVRQELTTITAIKDNARRQASAKANCTRWHGSACECWRQVSDD